MIAKSKSIDTADSIQRVHIIRAGNQIQLLTFFRENLQAT